MSRPALAFADLPTQPVTAPLESTQFMTRTARAAYQAHDYVVCDSLLARLEAQRPLPVELLKLRGMSAAAQGRWDDAVQALETALALKEDAEVVYYLAKTHAMLGCQEYVAVLIDDDTMDAMPAAIGLKMRALHRLGRIDEAIELGQQRQHHPQAGRDIRGLLANVLIDTNRIDEARALATSAYDTAEGCTASALLALDINDNGTALMLFRHAIALAPDRGRAHLGEGLCLLSFDNYTAATHSFDLAAAQMERHAPAWVVAAWVHLLAQNVAQARARFERACSIDAGYAEAHGGLAIVCLHEGRIDAAAVHTEQALHLSRDCLSGTLARSLLLMQAGDINAAQDARNAMLSHPLGRDGLSIAKRLARRAMRFAY